MSSKNVKSILTTAMLNADAAKETDAEETETTENAGVTADKKQFIKRALIATVATAASVYFVAKAVGATRMEDETDTSAED